jgi:hypothetical protein
MTQWYNGSRYLLLHKILQVLYGGLVALHLAVRKTLHGLQVGDLNNNMPNINNWVR